MTPANGDVSTTSASASTSRGGTRGQSTSGGNGTFQQHDNNRTDTGNFNSTDSGRSGGSGSSADVTLVKDNASGTAALTATMAHGSESGTSQGKSGGTSTSRSGGGASGTSFDVSGNDTSSGNGDSGVTRIIATRAPDAASREVVRTTAVDNGTLTNDGHAHQQDGATSRDGSYTLGQGGTTGVEFTSNSNSSTTTPTATGFQFGTLHGTLVNDAGLTGTGNYVTAAQNGGTRQSGTSNTTGHAKVDAGGTEGGFSLSPIVDLGTGNTVGRQWSGWLTTSTDTGNGTTSRGGTVTIHPDGRVTASDLSSSETGGGQLTTVDYSFSGRFEVLDADNFSYEDHQSASIFTTTTRNTAADGDQPATKSSTDTQEWNVENVDASITTSTGYTAGNSQTAPYYEWDKLVYLNVDNSAGFGTTTVTLAGNQASAQITTGSSREEGTISTHAWQHDQYFGSEPIADEDGEWIDRGVESWSDLESSSEGSEYSSHHTIDDQGYAHGGKFNARSVKATRNTSEFRQDNFYDGIGQDEYVFDDYQSGVTVNQTEVTTTTSESGNYEDLVFPFGIAIRVQSGEYDATQYTVTFSRTENSRSKGSSQGDPYAATKQFTEHNLTTEDDSQTKTTHGWYDVYGNGGSESKFRQDYENHKRTETDTDYTDYQGNVTHYYGRSTYDVEIHITPESVKGHGRDAGHGVNSSGPYDYDYPIEFSLTVTPPQNPPANVSNQTLAAQGEDGEQPASPGQQRPTASESLDFAVSDASPAPPDPPRRRDILSDIMRQDSGPLRGGSSMMGDATTHKNAVETEKGLTEVQGVIADVIAAPVQTTVRVGFGRDPVRGLDVNVGDRIAEGVLTALPVVFAYADDIGRIAKSLVGHADEVAEVAAEAGRVENKLDDVVRGAKPKAVAEADGVAPKRDSLGRFTSEAGGDSATAARGREALRNYRNALGEGYRFEYSLPSGGRADAVNFKNRIVRELKPDNPRAIQDGWRQVERYRKELEQIFPGNWTAVIDTYTP